MAGAVPSPSLGTCLSQAEPMVSASPRAASSMASFGPGSPVSASSSSVQIAAVKPVKGRATATARALQLAAPATTWELDVQGDVSADMTSMLAISNMLFAHRAVEEFPSEESMSREVQKLERSLLESQWRRLAENVNSPLSPTETNVVVKTKMSARERRANSRRQNSSSANPDTFSIDSAIKCKSDISIKDSPSDCVATFLTEIGKAKLLTKDEEVDLARRLQVSVGLKAARDRYVP